MPVFTPELRFAADCVTQASRMAPSFEVAGDLLSITKADGTGVTDLDYAIQAFAGSQLEALFPCDSFVAEEDSSTLMAHPEMMPCIAERLRIYARAADEEAIQSWVRRGGGRTQDRFWLMDPIDSTRGLLGGGAFSIHLAGVWDGAVQVAAIGYPRALGPHTPSFMEFSGLLFIAARGLGSWWAPLDDVNNLRPLHVSSRPLKDAIRLRPPNRMQPDQSVGDQAIRDRFSDELKTTNEIRSSTTVRYPLLATAQGDLYIRLVLSSRANQQLYPWDHAAGSLLLEEAGGCVTDMDGKPLDFYAGRILSNNRGLVASNGIVHDEALEAIRRAISGD